MGALKKPLFNSSKKLSAYAIVIAFIVMPSFLTSESNPKYVVVKPVVSPSCNLAVMVPTDLHLCDGEDFDLCGTITTPYSDVQYEWLENGNSTNYDLCETIDVDEETTFLLMVSVTSEDNLITNGDFENGDDGSFTSDYLEGMANCVHDKGYLGCEAHYSVIDNPSDSHDDFSNCNYNGNMMVVNGAEISQQNIWCQVVCVDPDASYVFSAWASSVHPTAPAYFQFSIDGNLFGDEFNLSSSTCSWEQFEEEWQSNGQTSIEICITNLNEETQGNDFALDDIEFYQICNEQAEFTVTVSDLELRIRDVDEINCNQEEIDIDLEITTTQNYQDIEWDTSDGYIEDDDGETITVSAGGTYFVTVTDDFDCEFTDEVIVVENTIEPSATILGNPIIPCNSDSIRLQSTTSASNPQYQWTDGTGNILGNQSWVEVSTAGTIRLNIIEASNGCESFDEITVIVDTIAVNFDLIKSGDLTCNAAMVQIHSSVPQDSINWTSNNGIIISENNDTILVTQSGSYYASVIKPNGCMHTDTITIEEVIPNFSYIKTFEDFIYCDNPASEVSISYDSNLYNFIWTGNSSSYGSASDLEFTQEGVYTFLLTDINGCTHPDSIVITEDFFVPQIFSVADTITCTEQEAEVSIGWTENIQWLTDVIWRFPDGMTLTGGVSTVTNQTGWVQYEAIMPITGCSHIDSIFVEASNDFPIAKIQGDTLSCNKTNITLSSEVSPDVTSSNWVLPDGTRNSDSSITTSVAGLYQLEVINTSGCNTTVEYLVEEDFSEPQIDLDPLFTITCLDTFVQPEAIISEPYNSVTWSGPNTNIDSLNLQTNLAGDYELTVIGTNGCEAKQTVSIILDTLPTSGWGLNPAPLLSCTLASFQADLWQDQNDNRIFTWETPAGEIITNSELTITQPGTYVVTAIGANGCPKTENYLVEQDNDRPLFSHTSSPITCTEILTEITTTAQDPNLQYEYVNAITDANIGSGSLFTTDAAVPINVIATDANGCTSVQAIEFTYDTIAPSITSDTYILDCNNPSTLLNIQASVPLQEQSIYSGNGTLLGNENFEISEPGNYDFIATSENGCTTAIPLVVEIDTSTIAFDVSSEHLSCDVTSVPVDFDVLEPFVLATIQLLSSTEKEEINYSEEFSPITTAGIYEVIVTASNGCTSNNTFEVVQDDDQISFSLEAENLSCDITSTEIIVNSSDIYTSGYAIHLGTQETYTDPSSLIVSQPGTYEVYLTGVNGCEIKEIIEIVKDDKQIPFSIAAGNLTCSSTTTELIINTEETYTSAYAIHLETQETYSDPNAFIVSLPGIYEVHLTGPNGCESIEIVEVIQFIGVPILESVDAEILDCVGHGQINSLVVSGGTPPYLISIDNGELTEFSPSLLLDGVGNHQVSIVDNHGCIGNGSFDLDPIEEISASVPPVIEIKETEDRELLLKINKPLEEIETINWQPSTDLTCYDCLQPTFLGNTSTTYTVYVEDIYGCKTEVEIRILIESETQVYVPNVINLNGNAENNRFTLFSSDAELLISELLIYDRWGNLMFINEKFVANDPLQGWDGYYKGDKTIPGVYTYMATVLYKSGETEIFAGDLTVID